MAYDVFISFKNTAQGGGVTLDRAIAESLHIMLRREGLEVFFSEKDISTPAFMDEIFRALDEAKLLILIGTSVEYINSEWVKSEWSTFFGSMKSGRKPDSGIITVLQGITTKDLPIQLEHFESFGSDNLNGVVDFAFKSLGKVKNSEAAARITKEQERKRKDAEFAAISETKLRMEAELQTQKVNKKKTLSILPIFIIVSLLAISLIIFLGFCNTDKINSFIPKHNPFDETILDDQSYRGCLTLVADVRSSDLINMVGDAENNNFLTEYEALFKGLIPDSSNSTAVKFRNCCFMVSYTEYTAKKYEYYVDDTQLGFFYVDDAKLYRAHADEVWQRLINAHTEEDLQSIIDYCAENDIVYLKNTSDET